MPNEGIIAITYFSGNWARDTDSHGHTTGAQIPGTTRRVFRLEQGDGYPVLGNTLRRGGTAIVFLIVGLLTTWASCWLGSRMSLRLPTKVLPNGSGSCREIGLCVQPWWITAAFLAYLFGPSLVFGVTGWVTAGAGTSVRNVAFRLVVLILLTASLYLIGYATGP